MQVNTGSSWLMSWISRLFGGSSHAVIVRHCWATVCSWLIIISLSSQGAFWLRWCCCCQTKLVVFGRLASVSTSKHQLHCDYKLSAWLMAGRPLLLLCVTIQLHMKWCGILWQSALAPDQGDCLICTWIFTVFKTQSHIVVLSVLLSRFYYVVYVADLFLLLFVFYALFCLWYMFFLFLLDNFKLTMHKKKHIYITIWQGYTKIHKIIKLLSSIVLYITSGKTLDTSKAKPFNCLLLLAWNY